jgi:hypothetical protein
MNKTFKRQVWSLHDFTQNAHALGEQMGEDPEVLTRLAQIISLFSSIVSPITPTADDPSAFIPNPMPVIEGEPPK